MHLHLQPILLSTLDPSNFHKMSNDTTSFDVYCTFVHFVGSDYIHRPRKKIPFKAFHDL